jgi:hypothetical protein
VVRLSHTACRCRTQEEAKGRRREERITALGTGREAKEEKIERARSGDRQGAFRSSERERERDKEGERCQQIVSRKRKIPCIFEKIFVFLWSILKMAFNFIHPHGSSKK